MKIGGQPQTDIKQRNVIGSIDEYEQIKRVKQAQRINRQRHLASSQGRRMMPRKSIAVFMKPPDKNDSMMHDRASILFPKVPN